MKSLIEQYGQFLVAVLIGAALFGVLMVTTVYNTKLLQKLVPDEKNMSLSFLTNVDVTDNSKIPTLNIRDSVAIYMNQGGTTFDPTSSSIILSTDDGEGNPITQYNLVSKQNARRSSKIRKGYLNIIGYDSVNTSVYGDYEVTYIYINPNTGYRQEHTLTVCVRKPYIPVTYIEGSGTQYISTGYVPVIGNTIIEVDFIATTTTGKRQDIIKCDSDKIKFGAYITKDGTWGYSYGDKEVDTGKAVTEGKTIVRIDSVEKKFKVQGTNISIDLPDATGTADGYLQILSSGASGRICGCRIYEETTLKRNLVACYDKLSSSFGMWETLSWTYYSNAGTGSFTCGDKISE